MSPTLMVTSVCSVILLHSIGNSIRKALMQMNDVILCPSTCSQPGSGLTHHCDHRCLRRGPRSVPAQPTLPGCERDGTWGWTQQRGSPGGYAVLSMGFLVENNEHTYSGGVFIDPRKAFDIIDHIHSILFKDVTELWTWRCCIQLGKYSISM